MSVATVDWLDAGAVSMYTVVVLVSLIVLVSVMLEEQAVLPVRRVNGEVLAVLRTSPPP